jgi:ATP-dependent DNA helicase PIF1
MVRRDMSEQTRPLAIDLNPQFRRALEIMEDTRCNVFITGRAGTGKSTLLQYFREYSAKRLVVLAPTGVAAVNVGGQTIHSFFGFKPDVTPAAIRRRTRDRDNNLYAKLSTIIIDEISMVRADLLDCVDRFLRLNGPDAQSPFGGVQMIFIGDLYQLPPVVTSQEREIFRTRYTSPYFFGAEAFAALEMEFIELEKVYRQSDEEFIRLLNAIRNRTVTDGDLELLNRRVDPDFEAPPREFSITLTSTNEGADRINEERLARLRGNLWKAVGAIAGEFGREYLPTAVELKLKKGAQIMLLNNDSSGRWVNGTVGRVSGFAVDGAERDVILADLETGERVEIGPHTWEIYRFLLKEGELAAETVGSFTQYPVRLAFAVTIHKSQGKTFTRATVDVGRGIFAPGQMYVALSRCTSLEGLVLKQPVRKSDILTDWQVAKFMTGLQYARSHKRHPREEKLRVLETAVREGQTIEILYLKAKDEKTLRKVQPLCVGEMEYKGRPFTGLEAFCLTRREKRVFNVDKILEITAAKQPA